MVRQPSLQSAPLRQQWRPSDWPSASLYCLVSRAFYLDPNATGGFGKKFNAHVQGFRLVASLHGVTDGVPKTIAHFLFEVFGADETTFDRRRSSDLVDDRCAPWICRELRYCEQCLRLGYHCSLYQLYGVGTCPEHRAPLRTGCSKCDSRLVPAFRLVAKNPFSCAKCGHLFLSSFEIGRSAMQLVPHDGRMAALATRLAHAARTNSYPLDLGRELPLSDAQASKYARSRSIWVDELTWGGFREERLSEWSLVGPQVPPQLAAAAALRFLASVCKEHWDDAIVLASRLNFSVGSIRLDGNASVVAVALCRTWFAYASSARDMQSLERVLDGVETALAPNCVNRPRTDTNGLPAFAFARVWRLEILSRFAMHLAEASKLNHLAHVSWYQRDPYWAYTVPWCHVPSSDGATIVRLRPRANEKVVLRLIQRYQHRVLREEPPPIRTRLMYQE